MKFKNSKWKYNTIVLSVLCYSLLASKTISAQQVHVNSSNLQPVGVAMSVDMIENRHAIKVIKHAEVTAVDQPTFVRVNHLPFKNGVIKVKVLSRLLKNAPKLARGFIGVAFRINNLNSEFECIYIRPTNGRADDQVRRNHSVQYFSYPEYPYSRLRVENPERYETYADMGLNEWTQLSIVVKNQQAHLFINNNRHATLIVNDLKLKATSGAIGLFVDVGTEGYFSDLEIIPDN
jgi:hypothetical protein